MGKMELEVKVLDIDKEKFIKKLVNLGAKFLGDNIQILYTYDVYSLYGRFIDLLTLLNNPVSNIKHETNLSKLKLLFFEIDNLLKEEEKIELEEIIEEKDLTSLLTKENILSILNKKELKEFLSKYHNNDNKWIRVRKTNENVTICVKHILKPNESGIQQMLENEVKVDNVEEANSLLEALGFSYKSYQEKRRISYLLDEFEIDIDTWPGIPTFFEVEGNSKEEIEELLNKLGYTFSDTVSCTADEIYRKYGKSMFDSRTLKFNKEEI